MKKKIIKVLIIILMIISALAVGVYYIFFADKLPQKTDQHDVMIYIRNSYDGPVNHSEDYLSSYCYNVYFDGTVEFYGCYNLSGKTDTVSWELSDEEFDNLVARLYEDFIECDEVVCGFDGGLLTLIYYDEEGNKLYKFYDYVYGKEEFLSLLDSDEMRKVLR